MGAARVPFCTAGRTRRPASCAAQCPAPFLVIGSIRGSPPRARGRQGAQDRGTVHACGHPAGRTPVRDAQPARPTAVHSRCSVNGDVRGLLSCHLTRVSDGPSCRPAPVQGPCPTWRQDPGWSWGVVCDSDKLRTHGGLTGSTRKQSVTFPPHHSTQFSRRTLRDAVSPAVPGVTLRVTLSGPWALGGNRTFADVGIVGMGAPRALPVLWAASNQWAAGTELLTFLTSCLCVLLLHTQ